MSGVIIMYNIVIISPIMPDIGIMCDIIGGFAGIYVLFLRIDAQQAII